MNFREKEINENYLKRIEEDQEREMRLLEERIRREVRDESFSLITFVYFQLGSTKIRIRT